MDVDSILFLIRSGAGVLFSTAFNVSGVWSYRKARPSKVGLADVITLKFSLFLGNQYHKI